ncbi:LLM class flavin-dependent oxidoreductase [Novosphingobium bradum]|uniref:LLM class flavin-dependent oxidoreductase n=1 Tax=Novosphingobium bradum TaxID=1737444 RepID=A0ABV7IL23_9SPHN
MYTMRFDMRAPANGAPTTELYAAVPEICAWAETRGCLAATLSEHHMSEDGYLPSPMILASAIAARTAQLRISIAIVQLPLYDPVRLAEDAAVLDILSQGRVSYVGGLGYMPREYEMHGVPYGRRGAIAEEKLALFLKIKGGEPVEHEGRQIHVTPAPVTPGGPRIAWGGGSIPAAERAGRHGLDFIAQKGNEELRAAYEAACRAHGHEPGMCLLNHRDNTTVLFVADDLDAAWAELGPYLMNDVRMYGAWNAGDTETSNISFAQTAADLRAENRSHRIVSVEEARAMAGAGMPLPLHPLIGGLPPALAWKYLRTVARDVFGHEV